MCSSTHIHALVWVGARERRCPCPGARATVGCELCDVGARSSVQVRWESKQILLMVTHLSSTPQPRLFLFQQLLSEVIGIRHIYTFTWRWRGHPKAIITFHLSPFCLVHSPQPFPFRTLKMLRLEVNKAQKWLGATSHVDSYQVWPAGGLVPGRVLSSP